MSDNTSWEEVSQWYEGITAKEGHFYHQEVILPGVLEMLGLKAKARVLDLGCGQGILSRALPAGVGYHGVDLSSSLIAQAQKHNKKKEHAFSVGDITKKLPVEGVFSHAALILALQNVEKPYLVFEQLAKCLKPGGELVIVLNHPCFRIPRQSHWGVDAQKKIQYRRLDLYLTSSKIPITAHPGKKASATTWSFHFPLSAYFQFLANAGFAITWMEEWISPKTSVGKMAKMENRAREEFPLFLALKAAYKTTR